MSIDLGSKPEGATHINPHNGLWIKYLGVGGGHYQFFKDGQWEMGFGCMSNSYLEIAKPEPWTGEGLPPVGTVCEFDGGTHDPDDPFDKDLSIGAQVTIIAHIADGDIAVFTFNPGNPNRGQIAIDMGRYGCFRLIRTAEQIAAEERAAVIEEIRQLLLSGAKGSIESVIYDAGYRKQVQA